MTEKINDCCPVFSPERWDKQQHIWRDKPFVVESIPTFFHIPSSFMIQKKVEKMNRLVKELGNQIENEEDILLLFTDPHPFKSEIYLSVKENIPDMGIVTISGDFISQVFDGGYNEVPKFMKQMDKYLKEIGKKSEKYYVHYAYCPKCSEIVGHNYMVLFAKV